MGEWVGGGGGLFYFDMHNSNTNIVISFNFCKKFFFTYFMRQ